MKNPGNARRQSGWTLLELVVAMTLLVLIGSFGIVRYSKTLETAAIDLAGGYLEAVWTAQRFYWLEHGAYASSFEELEEEDLLDSARPPAGERYEYGIRSADDTGFLAFARRRGSKRWQGYITIDAEGALEGSIKSAGGDTIEPVAR